MAQPVKRLTSAHVMISLSVSWSPKSGSVLTARGLEPASDSGSPSLSAPPLLMLCLSLSLSLSLSKLNKHLKEVFKQYVLVEWMKGRSPNYVRSLCC